MELQISPVDLLSCPPEVLEAMISYLNERLEEADRMRRLAERRDELRGR